MSYKMPKHSSILLAIVASTIILGSGVHAYAQTSLTVEADASSYETGDIVTITGQLDATTISEPILIQILDPLGNRDRIDQFDAAADGSYSYSFTAGGLMNTDGTYTVMVTYKSTEKETTTFDYTFTGVDDGWDTIQAMIGGQEHPIDYKITGSGNSLVSITGDVGTITLLATLSAPSHGTLSLRFDEETFDAEEEFFAFADSIPAIVEDESEGSTNIIHIDFEAGTEEIEIVGDSIVPEFGAIAAIILAVAIVGIIVATAKYNKLSFLRKDW